MRFYLTPTLILCTIALFAQEDWQLKKNSDGIKVYYRTATDSEVKELKIVTDIAASPEAVLKILRVPEKHPKWIYSCVTTETLQQKSENEIYFRDELDFPWPLSDRDIIGHLVIRQDAETGIITTVNNAVPDFIAEKKNIVRIQESKATWILTPKVDGTTDMTYFLRSHPGGSLPAWVVNLALDRGPVQSVKKLKALARNVK